MRPKSATRNEVIGRDCTCRHISPAPSSIHAIRYTEPLIWNVLARSFGNVSIVMDVHAATSHAVGVDASAYMGWDLKSPIGVEGVYYEKIDADDGCRHHEGPVSS